MKTTLMFITISSMCSALAGCYSPPVIPDGSNKAPINTQEKIDSYTSRIDAEIANRNECTALTRKYDSLIQQIAALKADILVLQLRSAALPQKAPDKITIPPAQTAPAQITPVQALNVGESIEIRPHSVIFRVPHPYNKAAFKPSPPLQKQLLKAARSTKRIEIRGRTDADADNAIDKQIASKRALYASRYLVSNGIESSIINSSHLAAGDHIADNTTAEGRAKNRRVEIEVTYQDTAAVNRQGDERPKRGEGSHE